MRDDASASWHLIVTGQGVGGLQKGTQHMPANDFEECPRRESNPDLEFRKPSFYPLNYGGVIGWEANSLR